MTYQDPIRERGKFKPRPREHRATVQCGLCRHEDTITLGHDVTIACRGCGAAIDLCPVPEIGASIARAEFAEAHPSLPANNSLGRWITGAKRHGEESDDPSHEAGDLIDLIYSLSSAMTSEQIDQAMATHAEFHGAPWGEETGGRQ